MMPIKVEGEEGREVVFGAGQPEYHLLPGIEVEPGVLLTRWSLDEGERRALQDGGSVDLFIHHFGKPLQPVRLQVKGVSR